MNDGVDAGTTAAATGGDDGRHTIITILFAINNTLFETTLPIDYDSGGGVNAAGGFGGVPASGEAITGLKRQKHGDEDAADAVQQTKRRRRRDESSTNAEQVAAEAAEAACAICLEDFASGDGLAVMPCAHRFHDGCLTQWLKLSRLCPCCRHALPSDGGGEAARPTLTGLAAAISSAAATAAAMANAAEGGGAAAAAAGANEGFQGGSGGEAETTRRRSRRARQANVRLFGPEWAADTSDDGLGLPEYY